jgi:hypothetical protein
VPETTTILRLLELFREARDAEIEQLKRERDDIRWCLACEKREAVVFYCKECHDLVMDLEVENQQLIARIKELEGRSASLNANIIPDDEFREMVKNTLDEEAGE